jgi:hypothetical protein
MARRSAELRHQTGDAGGCPPARAARIVIDGVANAVVDDGRRSGECVDTAVVSRAE